MSLLARIACGLLVVASALAAAGNAGAQQQPRASYIVDRWTVADGLPQSSVRDIVQTPDGYLWLATRDGLARFDGFSFTVFNKTNTPALRSNRVNVLRAAGNGTLWIGTNRQLLRYRAGHFEALADSSALAEGNVGYLAGGGSGPLWLLIEGALVSYRNGRFERLSPAPHAELRGGLIRHVYVDDERRLWLAYPHSVAVLEDARISVYTRRDGLPDAELTAIGENAAGDLRVGTQTGRLLAFKNGRFETIQRLSTETGKVRAYLFDGQREQTWTASNSIRAHRREQAVFRYDRREANAHSVLVLYEDRTGNVWAGTQGGGLLRLRPSTFTVYDAEDGLSYDVALSLTQTSDSALWVGTNCRGLNRLEDGRFTRYVDANVPPLVCPYAVRAARDGGLWVGHHNLVKIRPDGSSTRYELPYDTTRHEVRGDAVKALYEDPARPGVLWVGTIDGLYRFADGGVQRHYTPADGLPAYKVQYVLRSRRTGALWLSTAKGLSRLQNGQFTNFTPETSGFPSDNPRALYEDSTGALWIGTYGDGLIRYEDGQFAAITEADGLFDDVVSAITPDGRGTLWMSGNRGIFRARLEDLRAFADGRAGRVPSVGYGRAAGLKNRETNGGFQPAAWKDFSGRIWFPTLQGVAVVDPAEVDDRTDPPPAHVEQVLHQNEVLTPGGPQNRLSKGRRSFAFAYTGVNLSRPEATRFRYRLDGFDAEWQQAGGRRKAFYTNVPPGRYTFQVQAARPGGTWSEAAVLPLAVPPYFYETRWFLVLCGLLAVGLPAGGYGARVWSLRRRERQLQRRVDAQTEALSREKKTTEQQARRLAELDEAKNRFFANITHEFRTPLTLILGPLERMRDGDVEVQSAQVKRLVPMMLRNSRRLTRLIDQILDLTRLEAGAMTLNLKRADLAEFTEHVACRFAPLAERKHLKLSTDTPDAPCPVTFDPTRIDHVLGNLLSNAVKFTSEGGRVRVQLRAENGHAVIAVSDTGVGLSEDAQAHVFDRFFQVDDSERRNQEGAGIGLALTRELVELHGGAISVESTPGAGSTFTVRLPLREPPVPNEEMPASKKRDAGTRLDGKPYTAPSAVEVYAPLAQQGPPTGQRPATAPVPIQAPSDEADRTTVLAVDDNADVRAYLRSLLADRYHVLEAADGTAGLDAARAHLPDLILADVMMPERDGVAMTRALKDDAATDCIPVLMLTAKAGPEHAVEGLDAGAEDYVEKPFDADVLRAKVRATLAARRRLRERLQRDGESGGESGGEPPADASGEPQRSAFEHEVRAAIREHLSDPDFTVAQLASEVALSRSRFSGKLKEKAGITPSALIRQMRLEQAARLLGEEAGTVSEVAYAVGFNSLSYFSRRFKQYHGAPPSTVLADD